MSSNNVFCEAMEAIQRAKECIAVDNNEVVNDNHRGGDYTKNSKKLKKGAVEVVDTVQDGRRDVETLSMIEKRYEDRRVAEEKKDRERGMEINRFKKSIDDVSVNIEMKLREVLSVQTEDLAEKFGLDREADGDSLSRNMKALADRQMREKALLSLESFMTRFCNKKVHDELESASSWLDSKYSTHVNTFEKLGISVSDTEGVRPADEQREKDLASMLKSSELLLDSSSGNKMASGTDRISSLVSKLKEAQIIFKKESSEKIVALEKKTREKAAELRREIREVEDTMSMIKKRNTELDSLLQGTKQGQIRASINSQVKDIERRYEYHQQRQKIQISEIKSQADSIKLRCDSMKRAIQYNCIQLQMSRTDDGHIECDMEIDEHLTQLEEIFSDLGVAVEKSEEELIYLQGLSDDCKDELRALQAKNKEIQSELDAITKSQKAKVRELQNELKTLSQKKSSIVEANTEIHDRIITLTASLRKRKHTFNVGGNLNLSNADGQKLLMKAKLASSDVSEITADRVMQKITSNQTAPGHTRLWPNPNSSAKQDLIHFVEYDDKEDEEDEDTTSAPNEYGHSSGNAASHVCAAAYRYFALIAKNGDGKTKGKGKSKKKAKEKNSLDLQFSYKEAVSVCETVLKQLLPLKHLDKIFLNSKLDGLSELSREIPIMNPEDAEDTLFGDYCVPIITHLISHQTKHIVAENKMFTIRTILVSTFGLLGIIFTCLHMIRESKCFQLTPHPAFVENIENISSSVLKKIMCSVSTKEVEAKPNRTSKKKKSDNGDAVATVEIVDPIHPRNIFQAIDGAFYERFNKFKKLGLYNQIEIVRQWVDATTTSDSLKTTHETWMPMSSNGSPCKGKMIYSEDRFGLCAYQVLLYELSAFGLPDEDAAKYKKMSGSSLNSLKECLDNIKRPPSSYTQEFSDIPSLLQNVAPCSVPMIIALEYVRKLVDEELAKQSIFLSIENGENEDLQYLKSSRTSTAASSRVNTASLEEAFLKELPEAERQYLQDMKMSINLAIDDVLEAFEQEQEDDFDIVKISEFLKKHVTKHMYILDDLVFKPFDKEALGKVKTEIHKFRKHMNALVQARKKTLDVGGEFTKPLRNKLLLLNDHLASNIEIFYAKCCRSKILEAEIIEMCHQTEQLYEGNRCVVRGEFTHHPEELERIVVLLSKHPESFRARYQVREAINKECNEIENKVNALRQSYHDMNKKIRKMGDKLSYTSDEAATQGVHIIYVMLEELLHFFSESKKRPSDNALTSIAQHCEEKARTSIDIERILRHILSFFGDEDFMVLGAVFLDESISRSMSRGLGEVVDEERNKADENGQDLPGRVASPRLTTRVDAFRFSEKESKLRKGSGIDPRNVTNKIEKRMSIVPVDSFVNEKTLPTALVTTDALPVSRESIRSSSSRRPSSHDANGQPRRGRFISTSGSSRMSSSRESERESTDVRISSLSVELLEQYMPNLQPPSIEKEEITRIVPVGATLEPFNDSEFSSSCCESVSKSTSSKKTASRVASKKIPGSADKDTVVPLVSSQQKSTSRKATLALLSEGNGKVASYVSK